MDWKKAVQPKTVTLTLKQVATCFDSCEFPVWLHPELNTSMLVHFIFANFLVSCGSVRPSARGEFPTSQSSHPPHLLEGDIAVPEHHVVAGVVQEAFLASHTQLWPRGLVSYRFETFEWDGRVEPVFLDSQMVNPESDHARGSLHQVQVSWLSFPKSSLHLSGKLQHPATDRT